MTEYAAAREGAAIVALAERRVLIATGPQRAKFLHGMLSNDIASLAPGQGRKAALMDVKGHLIAMLRVLATADALWLEMPEERIAIVETTLVHYRVAAPVRFAASPVRVLALIGPAADSVLGRAGVTPPGHEPDAHQEAAIAGHGVRVARASDLPAEGVTVYVAVEAVSAVSEALSSSGAQPISRAALDVLRVESGRPWYGPDITADNLLHETGLVQEYHSASKGCYVGQEVVARLEARGGNVNKRLRGLKLSRPAGAGADVVVGDQTVGRLTTAAVSPRLGPIALAYVHRNHSEPGTRVFVEDAPAEVVALPFAHFFNAGP